MMVFSDSKWAKICPTAKYATLTLGKKSKKFQVFTFKKFQIVIPENFMQVHELNICLKMLKICLKCDMDLLVLYVMLQSMLI